MADGLPTAPQRAPGGESRSKRPEGLEIMTDHAENPPARGGGPLHPLQIAFWGLVAVGVAAAGVAITAGPSVGYASVILLVLVVAAGLVLFMWMARGAGRKFGPFPERGVIAAAALSSGKNDFAMLDA